MASLAQCPEYVDNLLDGADAEPTYNAICFRLILERIAGLMISIFDNEYELKLK